jgi:hypothetical protein
MMGTELGRASDGSLEPQRYFFLAEMEPKDKVATSATVVGCFEET